MAKSSTVSKGTGQDGAHVAIVTVNTKVSIEDAKSQYLNLSNKLVTLYSQGEAANSRQVLDTKSKQQKILDKLSYSGQKAVLEYTNKKLKVQYDTFIEASKHGGATNLIHCKKQADSIQKVMNDNTAKLVKATEKYYDNMAKNAPVTSAKEAIEKEKKLAVASTKKAACDATSSTVIIQEKMKQQFGFDNRTASILKSIYDAIRKKYQKKSQREINYIYCRAISQLCYNKGNILDNQWRAGAGYVYGYSESDQKKFYNDLGISDADYNYLKYMVRMEQNMVGNPDTFNSKAIHQLYEKSKAFEDLDGIDMLLDYGNYSDKEKANEKWNSWKGSMEKALGKSLTDKEFLAKYDEMYKNCQGKGDFGHMMYTIAANLADDETVGVEKKFPLVASYWTDGETRKDIAGWLGDATIKSKVISGEISFGGDDYIADLDSVNISKRLQSENLPFFDVFEDYYEDVQNDPGIRTREFKKYKPYTSVEKKVLEEAGVSSLEELKNESAWKDSYDFLMSLKNGNATMKSY